MMLRTSALVAAVAVAAVASAVASAVELNGWYPCELTAGRKDNDAQCAVFKAPLCYGNCSSALAARKLDVFAKRLVAPTRTEATPRVVIVQAGPGAQPLDFEAAMRSISTALGGDVDVYSLDRRGAGRSTKLDCVAAQAQAASSPGGVAISAVEVASCADELASKYAGDLSVFSLTSAARDVLYFVGDVLNATEGATFVYGAGIHSTIVERLIHLDTRGDINGFILDGVATTSGATATVFPYQSMWDAAYDAVGQEFLALCESDSDHCSKYFPNTTATAVLRSIVKSLDETPSTACAEALDGQLAAVFDYEPGDFTAAQAFRWAMGELLRRATLRTFIPVVAYRFARCNSDDAKVLAHFFETLETMLQTSTEQQTMRSSLLTKLIAFSEFWESPTPSKATMDARFQDASITTGTHSLQTYCAFTKDNSSGCTPFAEFTGYAAAPIAYAKDAFWNVAATPHGNASVLLLSGTLDPVAPPTQAQSLFTALNTTHKKLVEIKHAAHGALWATSWSNRSATCAIAIVASYVRHRGDLELTNTSCVATLPTRLSFGIESHALANWLNVSNAYDGAFLPSSNASTNGLKSALASPYKLAVIALCVLLGLVLVLSCVVVAKWRRGRKSHRGSTFCVDDPAYDEL